MPRKKQSNPKRRCPSDDDEDDDLDECQAKQPKVEPSSSANPLLLLENSLKDFDKRILKNENALTNGNHTTAELLGSLQKGGLSALYQFVGNMPKSRQEGMDSILKCLQCGLTFHSMELLVRHMKDTKHFSNLPRNISIPNGALPTSTMGQHRSSEPKKHLQQHQQPTQNSPMTRNFAGFPPAMAPGLIGMVCAKCNEMSPNLEAHLREVHGVRCTASDWFKYVKVLGASDINERLMSWSNSLAAESRKSLSSAAQKPIRAAEAKKLTPTAPTAAQIAEFVALVNAGHRK